MWTLAKFCAYPGLARVAIALIPRDIRHTVGLPTSVVGDRIALAAGRVAVAVLAKTPFGEMLYDDLAPQATQLRRSATASARPRISHAGP